MDTKAKNPDCKPKLAEGVLKLCAYKPVKGILIFKDFRITSQNNISPV
jgi:hypothetical protein